MKRYVLAVIAALIAASVASIASQNALQSPTSGTVSGLQLSNNYNGALDSLNTDNSGSTAPTNQLSGSASVGNRWLNTTSSPFPSNMFDGANWVPSAWLDTIAHAWNVQIGGGVGTLASASTVDLCSTSRNYLTISGTTTINSFGSSCPAGVVKLVTFSGATIITYNAASLIIPGAQSVSATSPGDQATLVSLGGGSWQVATYTPASGTALVNPAVDVGTVLMTFATAPPSSKYMWAYGQTISRVTYAATMAATTISQTVTRTAGSPTLTGFSDTSQIPAGATVESSGIPAFTQVASCTATTCTMTANASSSGTATATIFPNGAGDGATTFNLPNCADVVLAGRGNMSGTPRGLLTSSFFGASPDALSALGGSQSTTLAPSNLPNSAPSFTGIPIGASKVYLENNAGITGGVVVGAGGGGSAFVGTPNGSFPTITPSGTISSINGGVTQTSISRIQPTLTVNCMIRVLAMLQPPAFPSSLADNDNRVPVADRRRAIG